MSLRAGVVHLLYTRVWVGYARSGDELEQCFLLEIDRQDEPSPGSDPEDESANPVLIGFAWLPLDALVDDVQVSLVVEALAGQSSPSR